MKKFLAFCTRTNGLALLKSTDVSQALAWARSGNLTEALITELAALCKEDQVEFDPATAAPKRTAPATSGTRGASDVDGQRGTTSLNHFHGNT